MHSFLQPSITMLCCCNHGLIRGRPAINSPRSIQLSNIASFFNNVSWKYPWLHSRTVYDVLAIVVHLFMLSRDDNHTMVERKCTRRLQIIFTIQYRRVNVNADGRQLLYPYTLALHTLQYANGSTWTRDFTRDIGPFHFFHGTGMCRIDVCAVMYVICVPMENWRRSKILGSNWTAEPIQCALRC